MIFDNPTRDMFASSLGIVSGIVITIGAFLKAALGSFSKASPPAEDYSGSTKAMLNVLLIAPFFLTLIFVTPTNAVLFLIVVAVAAPCAFLCRQKYRSVAAGRLFKKPVPKRFQRIRTALGLSVFKEESLVGGDSLIASAVAAKGTSTDQELLALYGYDPAKMWDDKDRAAVLSKIERWYYTYVLLAVMTLVISSMSFQALVSGRAPKDDAMAIWTKAHPSPVMPSAPRP